MEEHEELVGDEPVSVQRAAAKREGEGAACGSVLETWVNMPHVFAALGSFYERVAQDSFERVAEFVSAQW